MHHVAVIYKRSRPEAAALADEMGQWLNHRHMEAFIQKNIADFTVANSSHGKLQIPESVTLVVVLGGDGTFLSVARSLENRSTPIIGVNLGGLGFLTEISAETSFHELEEILAGHFEIEERMRLQISVVRDGTDIFRQSVLNDAVINKGALARIVDLKTSISGRYLTNYRADGLIVATPTGSTAYNLSAGGPIVYPTAQAIVLTPICPFTLSNRPIILPPDVTIQIQLDEPKQDLVLTCDGQVGCDLVPSDKIIITAGPNPLRLIKTPSVDYFDILKTKLKWGQH